MPAPGHYSVCWDSHKNHLCKGFSQLQQNEEFVDMSIAAAGYTVKVHRNVIALASPYLKDLVKSIPTPHPVIFLNNVSYKILCYLLEYIYTGEVEVPKSELKLLIETAKSLHIKGLENLIPSKETLQFQNTDKLEMVDHSNIHDKEFEDDVQEEQLLIEEQSNENPPKYQLNNEIPAFSIQVTQKSNDIISNALHNSEIIQDYDMEPSNVDYTTTDNNKNVSENTKQPTIQLENVISMSLGNIEDMYGFVQTNDNIVANQMNINETESVHTYESTKNTDEKKSLHYSISNKGAIQLIYDNFIYYAHHQSRGKAKCRWRCIDYRRIHCPAFIDTDNEIMIICTNDHVHSHHEEKILKKIKNNLLFTSVVRAEEFNKRSSEAFITLKYDDKLS